MAYTPATQPEPLRQRLARSLHLYRAAFPRVIVISLVLSIVAFMQRIIVLVAGQNPFANLPQGSVERLWLILFDIIVLVLFTVVLWRIRCVMENYFESLQNDLSNTFKKMPRIIGAALVETGLSLCLFFMLVGVIYFMRDQNLFQTTDRLKMVFFVMPLLAQICLNIFIYVLLIFYLPLILTENKHIFEALGKSAGLVWGNWWRTFITLACPWCVYYLTLVVMKNVFQINIPISLFEIPHITLFATIMQILVFALFVSWFAATVLVQLKDLELRKKKRVGTLLT
jgi:hypothetical protein